LPPGGLQLHFKIAPEVFYAVSLSPFSRSCRSEAADEKQSLKDGTAKSAIPYRRMTSEYEKGSQTLLPASQAS
jgi:hypothetical protein